MNIWPFSLMMAAWFASGVFGSWLMRYPGEGASLYFLIRVVLGPVAICIHLLEDKP